MNLSDHPDIKRIQREVDETNAKALEDARETEANLKQLQYRNIQRLRDEIEIILDEYEVIRLQLRQKWRQGYELQQKLLQAGSSAQPFHQAMPKMHLPRARLLPTEPLMVTFTSAQSDIELFWALKGNWSTAA